MRLLRQPGQTALGFFVRGLEGEDLSKLFFGIGGSSQLDARLDEQVAEAHEADKREHPDQEEVLRALEELATVIDDARQAREPVVEGDHQAESSDRVRQDVVAHDREAHVPDDRHEPHHDRGHRRHPGAWTPRRT